MYWAHIPQKLRNGTENSFLTQTSDLTFQWVGKRNAAIYEFHLMHLSHYYLMYKFRCKTIVQVHFNADFMRKNILQTLGFEPTTFWLVVSCLHFIFLTGIWISPIHYLSSNDKHYSGGTLELPRKELEWSQATSPTACTSYRVGVQLLPTTLSLHGPPNFVLLHLTIDICWRFQICWNECKKYCFSFRNFLANAAVGHLPVWPFLYPLWDRHNESRREREREREALFFCLHGLGQSQSGGKPAIRPRQASPPPPVAH